MVDSVIALTLTDASTCQNDVIGPETKLWVGARRETTNPTHPNIVSVPTQRIPPSLADEILSYADRGYSSSAAINGHNALIYAVESLLSTKVVTAWSIEEELLAFRAAFAYSKVGFANYGTSSDLAKAKYGEREELQMINIHVNVNFSNGEVFPSSNSSYSATRWVSVNQFNQMMVEKDTIHVGLNPFNCCVDGLCVETTSEFLRSR
jgi:hypothetical protein